MYLSRQIVALILSFSLLVQCTSMAPAFAQPSPASSGERTVDGSKQIPIIELPEDDGRRGSFENQKIFPDFEQSYRPRFPDPTTAPKMTVSCTLDTASVSTTATKVQTIDLAQLIDANKSKLETSAQTERNHCDAKLETSIEERPDYAEKPKTFEVDVRNSSQTTIQASSVEIQPDDSRAYGKFRVNSVRPNKTLNSSDSACYKDIVVTFSEPMVNLKEPIKPSTLIQPVRISPKIDGKFYWMDQQTMIFRSAKNELPKATAFTIEIPATTKSLSGKILGAAHVTRFSTATPEPALCTNMPLGAVAIFFYQRIKVETLIPRLSGTVNGKPISFRRATDAETKQILGDYDKQMKFAFYPIGIKSSDELLVTITPGVQPVEGRLASTHKAQIKLKHDYPRFGINLNSYTQPPGWYEPGQPIAIPFTREVDPVSLTLDKFSVSPPVKNVRFALASPFVVMTGDTKADTTYEIKVHAGLRSKTKEVLAVNQTFKATVKSYRPRLLPPESTFSRLDPTVTTSVTIESMNVPRIRVKVYGVEKEALLGWQMPQLHQTRSKPLLENVLETACRKDELTKTTLELKPLIDQGHRQFLITVKDANTRKPEPDSSWYLIAPRVSREYSQWLQVSEYSITAVPTSDCVICMVVDSKTGIPVEGAKVTGIPTPPGPAVKASLLEDAMRSVSRRLVGLTGPDGICRLPLPAGTAEKLHGYCAFRAEKNNSSIITVMAASAAPLKPLDKFLWHTGIDQCLRNTPIDFLGWVKASDGKTIIDKNLEANTVTYEVFDQQTQRLLDGRCSISSNGGFRTQFTLPSKTSCGVGLVKLFLKDAGGKVISEYQTPFEVVELQPKASDFLITLDKNTAVPGEAIRANCLVVNGAGQPLANRPLNWMTYTKPSQFTPPGWSSFTFNDEASTYPFRSWSFGKHLQSKTNAEGRASLTATADQPEFPGPALLAVQGTELDDENHEHGVQSNACLIHREAYVGIDVERKTVDGKQHISVKSIVTKPDGTVDKGQPLTILVKRGLPPLDHMGVVEVGDLLARTDCTSGPAAITTNFQIDELAPIIVEAELKRDGKTIHRSRIVRGGLLYGKLLQSNGGLKVLTDKELYVPGETCNLNVTSPFKEARGFVTIDTANGATVTPVTITNHRCTTPIPIDESAVTTTTGLVKVFELHPESGVSRSAEALFSLNLEQNQNLQIEVKPVNSWAKTGSSMDVDVTVRQFNRQPLANAEVVVNMNLNSDFYDGHAAYGLFELPLDRRFVSGATSTDRFQRSDLMPIFGIQDQVDRVLRSPINRGCGGGGGAYPSCRFTVDNTILNQSTSKIVRTDNNGFVRVTLPVPQRIGRYRISSQVVGSNCSGSDYCRVDVIEPINVSCNSPPRVFEGDTYSACLELRNASNSTKELTLTLDSVLRQMHVVKAIEAQPGNTRVDIVSLKLVPDLKVQLNNESQTWKFSCAPTKVSPIEVKTSYLNDSLEKNVKVLVKETEQRRLAKLDIVASNSRLALILSAVQQMCAKDRDSTLQIAARGLALLAFQKLCKRLERQELFKPFEPTLREDVCQLTKNMGFDTRVTWLPSGKNAGGTHSYFPSMLAQQTLHTANKEGITVDPEVMRRFESGAVIFNWYTNDLNGQRRIKKATSYFQYLNSICFADKPNDWTWKSATENLEQSLQSYAIEKISDEELGWLTIAATRLPIYESLRLRLNERLESFAKTLLAAPEAKPAADLVYCDSSVTIRDAAIVMALRELESKSPETNSGASPRATLIEGLLTRIENRGKKAVWESPVATSMAITAMCDCLISDRKGAGEAKFSTANAEILDKQFADAKADLVEKSFAFSQLKHSTATLLSSESLRYGFKTNYIEDKSKITTPQNNGIGIRRDFSAADKKSKVWQDSDGKWHCTVGSNVIAKVSFVPQRRANYVVMKDFIAAGFSAYEFAFDPHNLSENYSLELADPLWEFDQTWPQDIEKEDHSYKVSVTAIGPRLYEFNYTLHATQPGQFLIPPATIGTVLDDSASGSTASSVFYVHQ